MVRSYDVTSRSKYEKSKKQARSPRASNSVQSRLLFTKLRNFDENCTPHFSLIGGHLERVSRTISVFELNLAPSEKRPTYEFCSELGISLSSYRVNIASCNICARAKVKGHRELTIEHNPSLVKLVEV